MLEVKYDLQQSVMSVMQNIEKRYGSDLSYMRLVLKDNKGSTIANLDEPERTLGKLVEMM
jgi:hypothetical protein